MKASGTGHNSYGWCIGFCCTGKLVGGLTCKHFRRPTLSEQLNNTSDLLTYLLLICACMMELFLLQNCPCKENHGKYKISANLWRFPKDYYGWTPAKKNLQSSHSSNASQGSFAPFIASSHGTMLELAGAGRCGGLRGAGCAPVLDVFLRMAYGWCFSRGKEECVFVPVVGRKVTFRWWLDWFWVVDSHRKPMEKRIRRCRSSLDPTWEPRGS